MICSSRLVPSVATVITSYSIHYTKLYDDEQIIDALAGEYRDRFMLHYNMPPYATGECGRVGSPKRREIGHGRLAKRALLAVLPKPEDFSYSMRVVSEITESNGSSSMASVCGGCLALMDARITSYNVCYTKLLRVCSMSVFVIGNVVVTDKIMSTNEFSRHLAQEAGVRRQEG